MNQEELTEKAEFLLDQAREDGDINPLDEIAQEIFDFCKYKFTDIEQTYIKHSLKQAYCMGKIDNLLEQLDILKGKHEK